MIKLLHTSDWHIGNYKGPVREGVNLRFADIANCLNSLVEQAKAEQPDIIVISGDIFNQAEVQANRVSQEVVLAEQTIRSLAETTNNVIVLRGTPNHDGAGQFRLLEELFRNDAKVKIAVNPQVIHTAYADFACVPGFDKGVFRAKYPGLTSEEENQVWSEEIGKIILGLRMQCEDGAPAVLVAHYTVPGCNTESGQTSFFANFEPVIPTEVLRAAGFDAACLGHIHRPQLVFGFENVYYAGAVNALNFNDEGQERGFYVHRFDQRRLVESTFHILPYRHLITLKWTPEDVTEYLQSPTLYIAARQIADTVKDKIVRVHYKCTPEQKESMNIPLLQSQLYEAGAFYVAEIEADTTAEITNKDLLSEESDPLANLKKWLDEKKFPDPDEIAELGEPIIRKAQMLAVTSKVHGVFRPVSISVHNYRNYKDAEFDFTDIKFCTINGQNGAGKSSLFMDAIIDALYEEPREGDLKGWIRATEDARGGSIEFVFDIGESRFRVVRTRVKSGRATLNISQLGKDGVTWENRSKERFADTQEEIINIIGMDSMTFRSCALIMQDQYGLFLQAKKEDRVSILANLLGLGIYQYMEKIARDNLADVKRALAAAREDVRIHTEQINQKGDPEKEMQDLETMLSSFRKEGEILQAKYDLLKEKSASYAKALEEYQKASAERDKKKADTESDEKAISELNTNIQACDMQLAKSEEIRKKAAECEEAEKLMKDLQADVVRRDEIVTQKEQKQREVVSLNLRADALRETIRISREKINTLRGNSIPEDIDQKISDLASARKEMEELRVKKDREAECMRASSDAMSKMQKDIMSLKSDRDMKQAELKKCMEQKKFLEHSGCPIVDTATCKFLSRAKVDADKVPDLIQKLNALTDEVIDAQNSYHAFREKSMADIKEIGYSPEKEFELSNRIRSLTVFENIRKQHEDAERAVSRLEGEITSTQESITQCEEKVTEVKSEALRLAETANTLSESVTRYMEAKSMYYTLISYIEQRNEIPLWEERRKNFAEKLESAKAKLTDDEHALTDAIVRMTGAQTELAGFETDIEAKLLDTKMKLQANSQTQERLNITKGTLTQKLEDIEALRLEIAILQKKIDSDAVTAVRYDALKQAFSQDGVPHQIIRNIIPHITDTANSILGSMTGGTMGVEFVLDKIVKGTGNEKATLDVLIDEYGKTKLPYAAKSGGEKVKSSLAVILSLSEIKATAAGIQLGMLHIDEPPFLDDEGTQAYVDAMEAIRQRYPNMEIMAITHDDAFKARFSQSVTVTKDDDGSHVQWD